MSKVIKSTYQINFSNFFQWVPIFSVMLTLHYNSLATYVIGFAFFLWSSTKQSMEQNKSQERVVILFLWSQIITTNKQTTTDRVNWLEETM